MSAELSDRDRAAIAEYVATLDIASWAPLTTAQRDVVRRALAATPQALADTTSATAA